MTVYDVESVELPEDYGRITMTYKQFRKLLQGIWSQTRIYRVKGFKNQPTLLFAFYEEKKVVLVCAEE